jgi:GNAT superfamily N-acetyltransferase
MIRKAELYDSDAIAEIIVEAWKDAYAGILDKGYLENITVEKYREIMINNIQGSKETIYVLEENGIIKGFISGMVTDAVNGQCEVVGFYILPVYQRMGIGSRLFHKIHEKVLNIGDKEYAGVVFLFNLQSFDS